MCKIHGVTEWSIVKGICDWGYKKNVPDKYENQIIAASAAVDYCFHVFSRDGVFESLIKSNITDGTASGMAVQPIISITNISGDNYTDNASNKSLGNGNTFNGPVYIGGK